MRNWMKIRKRIQIRNKERDLSSESVFYSVWGQESFNALWLSSISSIGERWDDLTAWEARVGHIRKWRYSSKVAKNKELVIAALFPYLKEVVIAAPYWFLLNNQSAFEKISEYLSILNKEGGYSSTSAFELSSGLGPFGSSVDECAANSS